MYEIKDEKFNQHLNTENKINVSVKQLRDNFQFNKKTFNTWFLIQLVAILNLVEM